MTEPESEYYVHEYLEPVNKPALVPAMLGGLIMAFSYLVYEKLCKLFSRS